jgi:hypothetical protein
MSHDRELVQSAPDQYHLFPATFGRYVDINVDLENDPDNICIEVAMIADDREPDDARAFSVDGETVGVIRIPVELVRSLL